MNAPEASSPDPEVVPPLTRRGFIKAAVGVAGAAYAAALGYPVYAYLAAPAKRAAGLAAVKEVVLDGADHLPAGAALMFKYAGRPAILLHHADHTWTALSAVCTHLGCTVQYEPARQRIYCACHGGVYDPKTGGNVAGPPPKPLTRYAVQVLPGKVVVSRG